jgi:hypothetical protein
VSKGQAVLNKNRLTRLTILYIRAYLFGSGIGWNFLASPAYDAISSTGTDLLHTRL